MWNDFKIGNVSDRSGSVKVTGGLGENANDYWWHDPEYNLGGRVSKDSQEGRDIAELVKSDASDARIDEFMMVMAISNMRASQIASLIKRIHKARFEAGKDYQNATIRMALGIHE